MGESWKNRLERLEEEKRSLLTRIEALEREKTCGQCRQMCWTLLQRAFGGALLIDEETARIVDDTALFLSLLGRREDERTVGLSLSDLLAERSARLDVAALLDAAHELQFRKSDGTVVEAEARAVRIPSGDSAIVCVVVQDISERKIRERALRHDATHDELTGLPNRRFFAERIQQEIAYHARRHKTLAVMVLDLDNFKRVNDSLGHRAGDLLLKAFAAALRKSLREYDIVARYGGDEFLIGLKDVQSLENVEYVAQKVLKIFDDPFRVDDEIIDYVRGTIGIAIYPRDGESADALFGCADLALYASKRRGKGGYIFCGGVAQE